MRAALLYILFFLSGTTALVYELVWVRELVLVFGGTTYAITTVLVAFMAGLGLGSYVAGRWARRLVQPGRVFGFLEVLIGLYALAVPTLLAVAEPAYRTLYDVTQQAPLLLNIARFAVGAMIVLVPATLMGATLPVLVRYVTAGGHTLGRSVGLLYGVNTFGAVLGVVLAGFWLLPTLGLTATTRLAAAVDIIVGIVAVNFLVRVVRGKAAPTVAATPDRPRMPARGLPPLLIGYAVSGFAAMVYQITWTRSLVMSVGSSTYSLTCILAAFILGLALGSLVIARWVDRWRNPLLAFGLFELLIGIITVVIMPLHGRIPLAVRALVDQYAGDYGLLLAWQFGLIIAITTVPTFLMGAIFPLVTRGIAASGAEPADATGKAYAANTVGTILGAFLAGFVLIRSDVLGVQNSIILASVLNGLVGVWLVYASRADGVRWPLGRLSLAGVMLLLIPVVAVGAGRWDTSVLTSHPFLARGEPPPREIMYYAEGVDMTVGVEHPVGHPEMLTMTVNGKPDASTLPKDMLDFNLLGHIPALLDSRARSACIVGLGSGLTVAALACHPTYERIDCVEISDDVIAAARFFDQYTYDVRTTDRRVRLIRADGRNHLLLTDQQYDVIISQPSNPWMSGVANLFTREYFSLARARLSPGGLFAVWLQGYGTSVEDFRMVVHTLFDVFDHVSLWELADNDYLLLASAQPLRIDLRSFVGRFGQPRVRADLYRLAIRRPGELLGRFITADEPLRRWAADTAIHTDDNTLLEFSAPRHMYVGEVDDILQALDELQRSVLDEFLADDQPALPEMLRFTVNGVVAARRGRLLANAAARRGDVAGALRIWLDGFAQQPTNTLLYIYLVNEVRALRAVPEVASRPEIVALLKRFESMPPPRRAPLTGGTLAEIAAHFRTQGGAALEQGNLVEALDLLSGALELEPADVAVLELLETALRRVPQSAELGHLRTSMAQGYALAAQQAGAVPDWPRAIELLRKARALEPDNAELGVVEAEALLLSGQAAAARALLDPHLAAHPGDGRAVFLRSLVAVQEQQHDAAIEFLARALELGPVTTQDVATDRRFEPLAGDARFQALLARPRSSAPAATP